MLNRIEQVQGVAAQEEKKPEDTLIHCIKECEIPPAWELKPNGILSVVEVLRELKKFGYVAFAVGSNPPDIYLQKPLTTKVNNFGREIEVSLRDTDIITNATTQELGAIPLFYQYGLRPNFHNEDLHTFRPINGLQCKIQLLRSRCLLPGKELHTEQRYKELHDDLMKRLLTICAFAAELTDEDKVRILVPDLKFEQHLKDSYLTTITPDADAAIRNEIQGIFLALRHATRMESVDPKIYLAIKAHVELLTFGRSNDFVNWMKNRMTRLLLEEENAIENLELLLEFGILKVLYPEYSNILENVSPKDFIEKFNAVKNRSRYLNTYFETTILLIKQVNYRNDFLDDDSHNDTREEKQYDQSNLQISSIWRDNWFHRNFDWLEFIENALGKDNFRKEYFNQWPLSKDICDVHANAIVQLVKESSLTCEEAVQQICDLNYQQAELMRKLYKKGLRVEHFAKFNVEHFAKFNQDFISNHHDIVLYLVNEKNYSVKDALDEISELSYENIELLRKHFDKGLRAKHFKTHKIITEKDVNRVLAIHSLRAYTDFKTVKTLFPLPFTPYPFDPQANQQARLGKITPGRSSKL